MTGSLEEIHEMRKPKIEKVVVNMSIGEGGVELRNAEEIVEEITGHQTVRTNAKQSIPSFGIRQGDPVGVKTTLRGDDAKEFLEEALGIAGSLDSNQFDEFGNFSFGIEEHTQFEEMEYDPDIGIFGMDVTVTMERKGKRVEKRRKQSRKIPEKQRLNREDATTFIEDEFEVSIE